MESTASRDRELLFCGSNTVLAANSRSHTRETSLQRGEAGREGNTHAQHTQEHGKLASETSEQQRS